MSVKKKVLIFTATFNEAENIEELIKSILLQPSKPDLLIIDDNSPDGTSNKIKGMQKYFKNLFLITRSRKFGLD
jgi:dolichol-phosphate mannosyltransferase